MRRITTYRSPDVAPVILEFNYETLMQQRVYKFN